MSHKIGSDSLDDSVIKGKDWGNKDDDQGNRGTSKGFDAITDHTLPGPGDNWGGGDGQGERPSGGGGGMNSVFDDDDGDTISSGGLSFGQKG